MSEEFIELKIKKCTLKKNIFSFQTAYTGFDSIFNFIPHFWLVGGTALLPYFYGNGNGFVYIIRQYCIYPSSLFL